MTFVKYYMVMKQVKHLFIFIIVVHLSACLVKRKCFEDDDCDSPKICSDSGQCEYECRTDEDCEEQFECKDYRCTPKEVETFECPEDMAAVAESFCMDIWEASRPDARHNDPGFDESMAVSQPGVVPWNIENNTRAAEKCEAAGKRLCKAWEWEFACKGTGDLSYVYGDVYSPDTCSGVDASTSGEPEIAVTGFYKGCVNEWGVFDLCGNFWEHVEGSMDLTVRGGSYKSPDPRSDHKCDYMPMDWLPCECSIGFRCCLTPGTQPEEDEEERADIAEPGEPDADAAGDAMEPVDAAFDGDAEAIDFTTDDEPEPEGPSACPEGMAHVGSFCIDRFEVSRSDATANEPGESTDPTVRRNVIPWTYTNLEEAKTACAAMDKHLCTPGQWFAACPGSGGSEYTYGDEYDPVTCNSIDTFCDCEGEACSGLEECPYPLCFLAESPEGGGPCGADYHLAPTGTFEHCVNDYGIHDMSGNAWELVDMGDEREVFRGGGYNSVVSSTEHKCDSINETGGLCPCSQGFRCCRAAEE